MLHVKEQGLPEIITVNIGNLNVNKEYLSLIPRLPKQDYESLKNEIAVRGFNICSPIRVNRLYTIIDGHTRYQIACELGLSAVPVIIEDFDSELEEKRQVIILNLMRRQLTLAQKAELGLSLLEIEREKSLIRQKAGGKLGGRGITKGSDKYVEKLKELSSSENGENNKNPRSSLNNGFWGRSDSVISRQTGVGRVSIYKVQKITDYLKNNENDDEIKTLWEEAKTGKVGINKVYNLVRARLNRGATLSASQHETIPKSPSIDDNSDTPSVPSTKLQAIEMLYDHIQKMAWTEEVDNYVVTMLIPLLAKKSEKVRDLVGDHTFAGVAEQIEKENQRLLADVKSLSRQLDACRKENDLLKNQILKLEGKIRDERGCNDSCNWTYENTRKLFTYILHEDVINAVDHLQMLINPDPQRIVDTARKMIATIASQLEWGYLYGVLSKDDEKYIDEFEEQFNALKEELISKGGFNGTIKEAVNRVSESRRLFKSSQETDL